MTLRLALPLALMLGSPAFADLEAMTANERAAFRAEVRAFLLENPEVLMEAIAVLEQREQQAQAANDMSLVAANLDALTNDGHSWVGGNPDGDLTVIEFVDYRCGYCRRAFAEVEQLVAGDGNIRFVVKEFPILGEQSLLSAQFAVAVQQLHGDAAYKDVHDALIQLRADANADSLSRLAEAFGLDPAPIIARMGAPEVAAVIEANHLLADQLQISGTPTFVIGDRMVRGYIPLAQMQQVVAEQRAD